MDSRLELAVRGEGMGRVARRGWSALALALVLAWGAGCGDAAADRDAAADAAADAADAVEEVDGSPALLAGPCAASPPDWSRTARLVPGEDRRDICRLGDGLSAVVTRGLGHALVWPVDVSGILLPWRPLEVMFDPAAEDDAVLGFQDVARGMLGFGTSEEMYDWVGLARADGAAEAWPGVAWPEGVEAGAPLGFGVIDTPHGGAMTFSCATCHTAELFGRTVVGMTNRRAQANEFFHLAGGFFPDLGAPVFAAVTGATDEELVLYRRAQDSFDAVGTRLPAVRGLDTSLAQVSLSLARRADDPWASRDAEFEASPRPNALETLIADSKPAVWWTLRYKTRWLSDGSIVSGNPVFTNFLWNELGRGTDLEALEGWLRDNPEAVGELTAAVFATEAPRWEDFFGAETIDLAAAQRGQALFEATCAGCHGTYEKGWDSPDAAGLDAAGLLRTTRVAYHAQTPVLDVGTDPQRAAGMASFADRLNGLAVSEWMGTVVEVQSGYVPPPLDGVWARYPYLHNQSVPTLCDLLSPAEARTEVFWMGPSVDPTTDYDMDCVGYPVGEATPEAWKEDPRARHDTSTPGLTNVGHDAWLVDADGAPVFDDAARRDLIAFLKTL